MPIDPSVLPAALARAIEKNSEDGEAEATEKEEDERAEGGDTARTNSAKSACGSGGEATDDEDDDDDGGAIDFATLQRQVGQI